MKYKFKKLMPVFRIEFEGGVEGIGDFRNVFKLIDISSA